MLVCRLTESHLATQRLKSDASETMLTVPVPVKGQKNNVISEVANLMMAKVILEDCKAASCCTCRLCCAKY